MQKGTSEGSVPGVVGEILGITLGNQLCQVEVYGKTVEGPLVSTGSSAVHYESPAKQKGKAMNISGLFLAVCPGGDVKCCDFSGLSERDHGKA